MSNARVWNFAVVLTGASACFAFTVAAAADVVVNGQVFLNDFGEFSATYDIGNATDQSGLSQNYVSGITDFDSFVATTNSVLDGNQNDAWFGESNAPLPGNLDFDLGGDWVVTQIAMWTYTNSDENALDDFDVYVDDNPDFSSPTFAGSFLFINSGPEDPRPPQVFDITDVAGRYVRLVLTSQNTNLVGMGEFAFGAVPAPGALALFGIAGMTARRRRHRSA